jgi:hypothetical protein
MNDKTADELRQFLFWWNTHEYGWHFQEPEALAEELGNCVQFNSIRMSRWLESPTGASIAQVVESVMPFPMGLEAQVMTTAIEIAARRRTGGQAAFALALGVVAAILIWGLFSHESFLLSMRNNHGKR